MDFLLDAVVDFAEVVASTLFGSATSSVMSTLGGGIIAKIISNYIRKTADPKKIYRNTADYIDERDIPQKITGEARIDLKDVDLKETSDTDEFI